MAEKKSPGGAAWARANNLVAVTLHFTEEERRRLGAAASLDGSAVRTWAKALLLSAAEKVIAEKA